MILTALAFKTTKYQIDRLQYTTLKDLSLMCFVQVKCAQLLRKKVKPFSKMLDTDSKEKEN